MPWLVIFDDGFVPEFLEWRRDVRKAASVAISALEHAGPLLNRPQADTLHGSRDANMKELRFSTRDGEGNAKGVKVMPVPFQKVLAELFSPAEQAEIRLAGRKIAERHLMLHELRKARRKTQAAMARKLRINQVSVSRLEHRADLLVSTLAKYVGAAGGKLHLVVQFPEQEPVILKGLGELAERPKPARRRKPLRAAPAKAAA